MKKQRRKWLKYAIIGVCVCLLAPILFLAGLGVYETSREIPEPVYLSAIDDIVGDRLDSQETPSGTAPDELEETKTHSESGAPIGSTVQVRLSPWISESESAGSRREGIAETLSTQMASLLERLERYERTKQSLTYEEAGKELAEIREMNSAHSKLINDELGGYRSSALEMSIKADKSRIWRRINELDVENRAMHGDLRMAAILSEHYLDDWDASVYYWREYGGLEGFYQIASRSSERKYKSFYEGLDRKGWLRKILPYRLDLN